MFLVIPKQLQLERKLGLGYMDKIFDTLVETVNDADLIILCAPVGSNAEIVRNIQGHLKRAL